MKLSFACASLLATLALAFVIACAGKSTSDGETPPADAGTQVTDAPDERGSVDYDKLGASCTPDVDGCPAGSTCAEFFGFEPPVDGPRCGPEDPCEIVRCPPGQRCRATLGVPRTAGCRNVGP